MKVAIAHHMTREEAKRRLQSYLESMQQQYAHAIDDVEHRWQDDTLYVALKAKGMKSAGTAEVTDDEVIIEGKLPLIARAFEGKIRSTIEREGSKIFRV